MLEHEPFETFGVIQGKQSSAGEATQLISKWLKSSLVVALVLFGIALVPIKDKPIEYHLLKFLGYRMRAMGRVYRTAQREALRLGQAEVAEAPSVPLPLTPLTLSDFTHAVLNHRQVDPCILIVELVPALCPKVPCLNQAREIDAIGIKTQV